MMMYPQTTVQTTQTRPNRRPRYAVARPTDADAVVRLFHALHTYNASLDGHFALSGEWEAILREQFTSTCASPNHLWQLVTLGGRPVALLIASIHVDSPLYQHREWVEIEALYVAPECRERGIASALMQRAADWATGKGFQRLQLYVTATNERAQSVYTHHGFTVTQAIMRKSLT